MAAIGADGVVACLVRAVGLLPAGRIGSGEAYCKFGGNRVVEAASDIDTSPLVVEGGGAGRIEPCRGSGTVGVEVPYDTREAAVEVE